MPGWGTLRGEMQLAHLVHASVAIFMMCVPMGHIYMGTIGMKGAYRAMKTGYVDEGWAREHHELWYDDIRAGKIPARRSAQAAPAPASATAAAPAPAPSTPKK
jgi:formate dehydrogenase subunit gamma